VFLWSKNLKNEIYISLNVSSLKLIFDMRKQGTRKFYYAADQRHRYYGIRGRDLGVLRIQFSGYSFPFSGIPI
jgi:hypothetical protein